MIGLKVHQWPFRQVRLGAIAVTLAALILPYFMLALSPDIEQKQSWCPVKLMTGMPCPGCGMLKSWCFLTHQDLRHSLEHHPLGIIAYGFGLMALVWLVAEYYHNRPIRLPWYGKAWVTYLVVAIVTVVHFWRLSYLVTTPGLLWSSWQKGYLYKTAILIADLVWPT